MEWLYHYEIIALQIEYIFGDNDYPTEMEQEG